MKERPILFSAPMVRVLLAGTKMQTRRIVKPEGAHTLFQFRGTTAAAGADEPTGEWAWCASESIVTKHIRCPYGKPGDRLWVRETHELHNRYRNVWCTYSADGARRVVPAPAPLDVARPGRRPGIHMHRWASRITLEITEVRVERLNDISDADARAEGWPGWTGDNGLDEMAWYSTLWDSINGCGSWDANPWVWCIHFRRLP